MDIWIFVVAMIFFMILLIIGVAGEYQWLQVISGLILMIIGIIVMGQGIAISGVLTSNIFTFGFGLVMLALSIYIIFRNLRG
jgi:hypothetical protein